MGRKPRRQHAAHRTAWNRGGRVLGLALCAIGFATCTASDPTGVTPTSIRRPVASLVAGQSYSCGVTAAWQAYCWGYGSSGELGTGDTREQPTPQLVGGGHRWALVTTGSDGSHTCGITTEAHGYCWGSGFLAQLGTGERRTEASLPQRVSGLHQWASLSAGNDHTCGVTTTGEGYCWGYGRFGALGTGDTLEVTTPQLILGGHRWAMLSAGGTHTCGVTNAGQGYCWGSGYFGQLGTGISHAVSPQPIVGGHQWALVSAGNYYTCGVTRSGDGFCWGEGREGQLGVGSRISHGAPQRVVGDQRWVMLAAGYSYTCGVTTADHGYCWGDGGKTNMGFRLPSVFPETTTPQRIAGGHAWITVTVGYGHACGVTISGQGFCWGYGDDGRLGTGNTRDAATPQLVVGEHRWVTRETQ
jgi:alpha-tubulin suppressor-like RCC1 family protein